MSQMDITTDGFGFMLSFGDLTWLPFTYGLQARYLAFHPVHLGLFWSAVIIAIKLTGLYIFRVSNNEKGHFRNGQNPKSGLGFVSFGLSSRDSCWKAGKKRADGRLDFHADREGDQAIDFWVVGSISTPCEFTSLSHRWWGCIVTS